MEKIINNIKIKSEMPPPNKKRDAEITKIFNEMMDNELLFQNKDLMSKILIE